MSSAPPLSPTPAVVLPESPSEGATLQDRRGTLVFCLFALYVIWGSTYLAMHWGLEGGLPPFLLATVRYLLAGSLLYTGLRLRGEAAPTARQWGAGALMGLLLLVLGNGSVVFAQQWMASGVVALVVGSVPLWTALFGGLFGQWPGRAERWGLGVGFAGLLLLKLDSDLGGSPWLGFALLLGPVSWAFGSVLSHRLPLAGGLMSSATQMLPAGVFFLAISLARGEHLVAPPTPRALLSVLYLVVFGSLVAFSAYGWLLRHARPSVATSYAYVNPGVAVLLGTWLAGESLSPRGMVAMGAILGAVVLITRARR